MLNCPDCGVGIRLHLQMTVPNEIACYTINSNCSDGCCVCFVAREYAAEENRCRLDGYIVKIVQGYKLDDENLSMWCLYHHTHGYACAIAIAV